MIASGKKSSKDSDTDDKQLIALLRSQILTYQSENEQLKQKITEVGDYTFQIIQDKSTFYFVYHLQ